MLLLAARADFGFGNPNLAGALFAMLAVGVWGLGSDGRSMFWVWLVLSVVFAGLVVMTASRGAMVALGVGGLAFWIAAGCPKAKGWQIVGLAGATLLLGIFAGFGRMGERVAESSLEEGSIDSRLAIFRVVPAMLSAAPQGWGSGQSAEAYQNWFQAPLDVRAYKHLLSTHATWMAERGWGFRFAYIFGWAAILALCRVAPGPLGVWVAFGVAGIFSHVGGDWRLWIVPGLALIWALVVRMRRHAWPGVRVWRNVAGAALVMTAALCVIGLATNQGISRGRDMVMAGGHEVWFYAPDAAVLGAASGKVVRKWGAAGVAWAAEALIDAAPRKIILSGRVEVPDFMILPKGYDILWINPPARLDEGGRLILERAAKKTIAWGELRTDASPRLLKEWFEKLPGAHWVNLRGKGLFAGTLDSELKF